MKTTQYSSYLLTNVLLETGYVYEDDQVTGTKTAIFNLRIDDGMISEVLSKGAVLPPELPRYDARGLLLLPSFREMHIHLDKTFYGGPWRAVRPAPNGKWDRIREEQELLPLLLPTAQERAEKLIEMILGYGSTYVRSHCNIDPVIGVNNLESLLRALDHYKDKISHEIVAFPQHGLVRPEVASSVIASMKEAMRMGVTHVGGIDPATVDGDMEKSLQTIIELAVEYEAGIDIHLHDGGETGLNTIRRLADLTEEAGLQGRVTVSHAFSLASAAPGEDKELAGRLASLGISIASSVPAGKGMMPIPLLMANKVEVMLGNDSIIDHWSPFGTGDILQKSNLAAQLYGWSSEYSLSRALALATGGVIPLDEKGVQVWPAPGVEASGVLVDASCSAEAVARLPRRVAVFHRGNLASGSLDAAQTFA
ncbi:deaminase [Paenibacillus sp. H1-7]|uniref:amidohydrolase n=1 Tax=Paenibacillus sp. H1-7 TaxID=2282849 RepID=UPI001EF75E60|nr:amidohydrolase [Paenibacillus sp. H1-7]ULL19854.1 deaminase [Paenibacillus sp. H1-7]